MVVSGVIVMADSTDPELLAQRLPGAQVHTISDFDRPPPAGAGNAVAVVLRSGVRLGAEQLGQLPWLRHVVRPGSGVDNLDLVALARRGVTVHRNPHVSAEAVAEWILVAALALARRVPLGHAGLARGQYLKAACLGRPLSEYRVAVWGAGPVGMAASRLLGPLTADLVFADWPSLPAEVPRRPGTALAAWADLHVVALPLRESTRGQFGRRFLDQAAARQPVLVCAGRPDTLDLWSCRDALRRGDLAGLAVDGIEKGHLPLLADDGEPLNLLVTPHLGAQRTDVRQALDTWVATTLSAALDAGEREDS